MGVFDDNFRGWGYEDLEMGYRLHKSKMRFIKRSDIVNYHLTHGISVNNMADEALENLKCFSEKIKGDFIGRIAIFILGIRLHLRSLKRNNIRSTALKY